MSSVLGHGYVECIGTAKSTVGGKDVTFNGGELYLFADSGMYVQDHTLWIKGGSVLDVEVHGAQDGVCGQLIALSNAAITLDDTAGTGNKSVSANSAAVSV